MMAKHRVLCSFALTHQGKSQNEESTVIHAVNYQHLGILTESELTLGMEHRHLPELAAAAAAALFPPDAAAAAAAADESW